MPLVTFLTIVYKYSLTKISCYVIHAFLDIKFPIRFTLFMESIWFVLCGMALHGFHHVLHLSLVENEPN